MPDTDDQLRAKLVALGVALNVQRYPGQHATEAAHEFAAYSLKIVKAVEDRIVERVDRLLGEM